MTYEFTTKAEYLAAKAQWKVDHKAHLTAVRAAKNGIKIANREYSRGNGIAGIWQAYTALQKVHEKTDEMLATRVRMSAEAQRQYLARTTERIAA